MGKFLTVRSMMARMCCPPLPMIRPSAPSHMIVSVTELGSALNWGPPPPPPPPPPAVKVLASSIIRLISAAHSFAPTPVISVIPSGRLIWMLTWNRLCRSFMVLPPRPMIRPSWPPVPSIVIGAPAAAPTDAPAAANARGGNSVASFASCDRSLDRDRDLFLVSSSSREKSDAPPPVVPPAPAACSATALSAMACALRMMVCMSGASAAGGFSSAAPRSSEAGATGAGSGAGAAVSDGSSAGSVTVVGAGAWVLGGTLQRDAWEGRGGEFRSRQHLESVVADPKESAGRFFLVAAGSRRGSRVRASARDATGERSPSVALPPTRSRVWHQPTRGSRPTQCVPRPPFRPRQQSPTPSRS